MDESKILLALPKIEPGLRKYLNIMNRIHKVDVTIDADFQRSYNGFYRVRQRKKDFYDTYYSFMEDNKNSAPSFEETLLYIHKELGRVEASFSSKLVATLNPDMPIWDSVVLQNLNLKMPNSSSNRLFKTIMLYDKICRWYAEFKSSDEGKSMIELFDNYYPGTLITDTKKVDFVLWQIR